MVLRLGRGLACVRVARCLSGIERSGCQPCTLAAGAEREEGKAGWRGVQAGGGWLLDAFGGSKTKGSKTTESVGCLMGLAKRDTCGGK